MAAAWTPDSVNLIVADTVGGTNGLFAIATDGSGTAAPILGIDGSGIDFVGSVLADALPGPTDLPTIDNRNYGTASRFL